jgi:hypothetical protein
MFGNIQRVPASALNPIIKPWPFRGWGIDLIGQINPPSSKGHKFVLLATNYFTKWVEAIPLKVTSEIWLSLLKSIPFTGLELLTQLQQIKELSLHLQSSEILLKVWGSNN